MTDIKIEKPIFIIGCPRSGTGIFQNLIKLHPDVAYVTPATNNLFGALSNNNIKINPPTFVSSLIDWYVKKGKDEFVPERFKIYDGIIKEDGLPDAVEPSGIWTTIDDHFEKDYLDENDVIEKHRKYLRDQTQFHLKYFKTSRFLNKRPKDSLRIRYINRVFPDSIFLHLIRDGRAVANSIYNRKVKNNSKWFGLNPPGWEDFKNEKPIIQAGWQWKKVLDIVEEDSNEVLDKDRYLAVKYEGLTERPMEIMKDVFQFCELDRKKGIDSISSYSNILENRNYKWKKQLSDDQKKDLMSTIKGQLRRYNYLQ